MLNLEYMAAAYTIIWAAILFYFIGLARKERDIWTELKALRATLENLSDHSKEDDS